MPRREYRAIARAIWEPVDQNEKRSDIQDLDIPRGNSLVTACKNFLDVFESLHPTSISTNPDARFDSLSEVLSPSSSSSSSFLTFALTLVLRPLIQAPSSEAFIPSFTCVKTRLLTHQIPNIRALELELVCAGKLPSQSKIAYARFQEQVERRCDVLYAEMGEGGAGDVRRRCWVGDIGRVKGLFPEEEGEGQEERAGEAREGLVDEFGGKFLIDLDYPSSSQDLDALFLAADPRMAQASNSNPTPRPPQTPTRPGPTAAAKTAKTAKATNNSSKHQCHCGYTPLGADKWKASNLRRHKRFQHAQLNKSYECGYPRCRSTFTRSDNLRSHVREKGHEEGRLGKDDEDEDEDDEGGAGDMSASVTSFPGVTKQSNSKGGGGRRR